MVTVSKHVVKETPGTGLPIIMILPELAGLPVTQLRLEVITHRILSPTAGLQVNVVELVPVFTPFNFH